MRRTLGEEWLDAVVPGSVYADLLRHGKMEDPFWRDNELKAFELIKEDYTYECVFTADEELFECDAVRIVFEGLDTISAIYLNGKMVMKTNNMHLKYEMTIKDMLKRGENTLRIDFTSPIDYILGMDKKLPGWASSDATPGFQHLRKAHCMFGWDWGPRLPDMGIWRPCYILGITKAYMDSVQIHQTHENGSVRLDCVASFTSLLQGNHMHTQGGALDGLRISATLKSPDGKLYTSVASETNPCISITVDDPQLWWPNGMGKQPLYELSVSVSEQESGEVLDTWTRRIGLRTLTIKREKDEYGESFCHVANGVDFFAMGADYIPEDNILARVTPERTRKLLEDCVLAHFNCIRIWGGGYYPDDWFFDICDELGLVVWQDFMFACAMYDLTPEFEMNIRMEAYDNIVRLRHHASLGLWCGNNEMEMFQQMSMMAELSTPLRVMMGQPADNPLGPRRHSHMADYIVMFEKLLPEAVRSSDPQTYYWPASPSSGGAFDAPNDPNRGDVHYWDVWHGEKPFTDYRNHYFRYASEFGFQSFPCIETVESFTLPEDRNIFSAIMERHQRNASANGKILNYLSQMYLYPYEFETLLYASQLLQADAIRYGVEHWRRNRGRCMGAVYWQLNDCWPVASWASIDYFGRWKALHYVAKRFFAPVMISACEEGLLTQRGNINAFLEKPITKSVRISVANESGEAVSGTVIICLRDNDANIIEEYREDIIVEPRSSKWLDTIDYPDADTDKHYVSYDFVSGSTEGSSGNVVSSGTVLFSAPKHFNFNKPKFTIEVIGDSVTVASDTYARYVQIITDDPDAVFEDNFFDLNADSRTVRLLRGTKALDVEKIRVRSVYDIGR